MATSRSTHTDEHCQTFCSGGFCRNRDKCPLIHSRACRRTAKQWKKAEFGFITPQQAFDSVKHYHDVRNRAEWYRKNQVAAALHESDKNRTITEGSTDLQSSAANPKDAPSGQDNWKPRNSRNKNGKGYQKTKYAYDQPKKAQHTPDSKPKFEMQVQPDENKDSEPKAQVEMAIDNVPRDEVYETRDDNLKVEATETAANMLRVEAEETTDNKLEAEAEEILTNKTKTWMKEPSQIQRSTKPEAKEKQMVKSKAPSPIYYSYHGFPMSHNIYGQEERPVVQVKMLVDRHNTFRLFPELPEEIRAKIWRKALRVPSKVTVRIYSIKEGEDRIGACFIPRSRVPPLLQACKQSRQEALIYYKLAFSTPTAHPIVYFNHYYDHFYLNTRQYLELYWAVDNMVQVDLLSVRKLTLKLREWTHISVNDFGSRIAKFKSLSHLLLLVSDSPEDEDWAQNPEVARVARCELREYWRRNKKELEGQPIPKVSITIIPSLEKHDGVIKELYPTHSRAWDLFKIESVPDASAEPIDVMESILSSSTQESLQPSLL